MKRKAIVMLCFLLSFSSFAKDSSDDGNPSQSQENNNEQTNSQTNNQTTNQTATNTNTNTNSSVSNGGSASGYGGTGGSSSVNNRIEAPVNFVTANPGHETIEGVSIATPSIAIGASGTGNDAAIGIGISIPIIDGKTKAALHAASLEQQYKINDIKLKNIKACLNLQKEGYTTSYCVVLLKNSHITKYKY